MQTRISFAILLVIWLAPACEDLQPAPDLAELVESLALEVPVELDVECPPEVPAARQVLFAATFQNMAPIPPEDPRFPVDFCPSNAAVYVEAYGRGNSTPLGEFTWTERYCAGASFGLVAEGHFEGMNGDQLRWTAQVRADPDSPPVPFRTFSGEFEFVGGTGQFEDASGTANIVASQLGDAELNRPGTTAAAICGWVQ